MGKNVLTFNKEKTISYSTHSCFSFESFHGVTLTANREFFMR